MKKHLRLISLVLMLVMSVFLFDACDKKETYGLDPKAPVTVTVWHYYNGAQREVFDQAVAAFNASIGLEKGIIVYAQSHGSVPDLIAQVMNAAENKVGAFEMPTVFASYADTAYSLYQMGMLANLNDYLSAEDTAKLVKDYIVEGQFSDKRDEFYIFPIAKSTEAFFLNKTAWDRFANATGATTDGFKTWEGINAIAKDYYDWTDAQTPDVPNDGKAFTGRDAMANYVLIGAKQLGHELFTVKDGKATFDLDRATLKRIWENYYIPYISGHYVAYGRFRSDDAKTGDIISLVGSTSSSTYFPREVTYQDATTEPIEGAVYALPNFEGTKPVAVQQGAGMVVTKTDKAHEYAATLFLKWFVEPEQNVLFSIQSGYLPVTHEGTNKENLNHILDSTDITFDALTRDTVDVGLDISNSYTLFTPQAFDKGTPARAIFNDSLQTESDLGRKEVEQLIQAGTSREDAIAALSTDDVFEKWYQSIVAAIGAL